MGIIYALCYPATDEIRYIGQTIQPIGDRLKRHVGDATGGSYHVHRWIRKLRQPPKAIILEETDDLDNMERLWIAGLRSVGYRLCNMTPGGMGGSRLAGWHHTKETRRKLSAANVGNKNAVGHTLKHTEDAKRRIGESARGRPGPWKGKTFTDAHKTKLSTAQRGNTQSLLAAHTRWHTNRGVVKEDCLHCRES